MNLALLKPKQETLADLVSAWSAAKNAELEAQARRRSIEERIVLALPAEGEGTIRADVAGMRVSVERSVTRKVDSDALGKLWSDLPTHVQAAFKWEAKPVLKELRAIQQHVPEWYAKLAQVIEVKPAKPSVKVEPIEARA